MNKYQVYFHGSDWYVEMENGEWLTKRFKTVSYRPDTPCTSKTLSEAVCMDRGFGYYTQIPMKEFHREALEDVCLGLSEYADHLENLHRRGFALVDQVDGERFQIRAPMKPIEQS